MSKGNPDNNSLVFTRQFHDPYKFAEAIKPLKIKRGTQLSPGSFLGTRSPCLLLPKFIRLTDRDEI